MNLQYDEEDESTLIDWKDTDAKDKLYKELDRRVSRETETSIEISNIISQEFCDLMDVEDVTDFNGWQCDWWNSFEYNFKKFDIMGGAWYGTISISIPE